MANPGSIIGQITEEFEQLGKQVVKETVKAPKDIAGKALESLGTTSGKKPKSNTQDEVIKKTTARSALEELAGRKPKPKEPTVAERMAMEDRQRKEMEANKEEALKKAQLPIISTKPKRGNLYRVGVAKSVEKNRNVRQD